MTSLTMSWAFERARYGRRARSVPSRFLFEAEGEEKPRDWVGVESTVTKEDDIDLPTPRGRGKKAAGAAKAAGAGKKKAVRARRAARRAGAGSR
jgi:hypothetical protein